MTLEKILMLSNLNLDFANHTDYVLTTCSCFERLPWEIAIVT